MGKQKNDPKQTINQFAIYDVAFYENPQTNAFSKISVNDALNKAYKLLGNFLSGSTLSLYREITRDGSRVTESLPNDILSKHEDVYLLRINNKKFKNVVQEAETTTAGVRDYEEKQIPTNPYCYVIFDNRDCKHFVAIQKNSAFGDPNTVRLILEDSINLILQSEAIPIEVNLYLRIRPAETWEFCEKQCLDNGDAITRVSFTFPNQKKIAFAHRVPKEQSGIIKKIAQISEYTNALKTLVQFDYSSADPFKLKKHASNFAEIIRICNSTEYNLYIHFRDYGKYGCDEHVKALFPMPENLINAFRLKWKEVPFDQEFGLINWCDEIYQKSQLYKNYEKTPRRRKRKNRK